MNIPPGPVKAPLLGDSHPVVDLRLLEAFLVDLAATAPESSGAEMLDRTLLSVRSALSSESGEPR